MRTGKTPKHSAMRLHPVILVGAFIFVAAIVPVPIASSTSRSLLPIAQSLSPTATYAADCTTPKTTFNLGDTVCARAEGLTGFRFAWVDPDGFILQKTDIMTDPQTDSFTLPSTDQSAIGGFFTANNLGTWRVNAITSRGSVKTGAFFTVKDPNHATVDLSIVKSIVGGDTPIAGAPVQFAVTIENLGPNDAVNAHFVDNTFTNATFDSLTQTGGPAFACKGADCTIASLPNGDVASFILNFTAGTAGGDLENTASVSSDITELHPADNSSESAPIMIGTGGTSPTCNLVIAAPADVTVKTGPGATVCGTVVSDATLGTASASDDCPGVTVSRNGVPSGNLFPVGDTLVSYTATDVFENTATATQTVTVVDNTSPAITCPASITLEPTCPSGAVAIWTAPVGSDNCPGATTAQSGGPANGSVFPIGTTTVAYTVLDAAGNQTSCGFTVTVLTVSVTIQNLKASVNGAPLNGPQQQGLIPKLDAALDALDRTHSNTACQNLAVFINSVQNYIDHGNISAAQGQAWINSAANVRNTLGCTNNPCM